MSRQSPLIAIEHEITGQLQRIAIDIAGDQDRGRVLWQAAEWGQSHPLMPVYEPIAVPLLMARDALMSEWLARSRSEPAVAPAPWAAVTPTADNAEDNGLAPVPAVDEPVALLPPDAGLT